MPQFRRRDMETDANVSQTVSFLRGLLPLDLYVTLGQGRGGHPLAAKGRLCDVVDEDAAGDRAGGHRYKNRVGVRVQYNGVMHRTLCSAGKEMRKSLREELYREDTGVATFDSWHRTKVHLNGQIYRMKELIPPEVRRGTVALRASSFLGGVPLDRRDHHLHQVLRAGQVPTVVDGTTEPAELKPAPPAKRRRTTAAPALVTVVSPIAPRQLELVERSMTMLRETFPAIESPGEMLGHLQAMGSNKLESLGVPRILRETLCAKN